MDGLRIETSWFVAPDYGVTGCPVNDLERRVAFCTVTLGGHSRFVSCPIRDAVAQIIAHFPHLVI
jgi:hypothetical protein